MVNIKIFRKVMLLASLSFSSFCFSSVKFVSVDGIDVPIVGKKSPSNCARIVSNKINIIYVDDITPTYLTKPNPPESESYNGSRYGGNDPNTVQDLVTILALAKRHSDKINLVAVGSTNQDVSGHNLPMVRRAVSTLTPNLGVEVLQEGNIARKIYEYANCANIKPNAKLRVAMGGPWNKLQQALNLDSRAANNPNHTRFRIAATLLGGANISSNTVYFDGNPAHAKAEVESKLGENMSYWQSGAGSNSFRNVFNPSFGERTMTSDELDEWYKFHLKPQLRRVTDSLGNRFDSENTYEHKVLQVGYNPWGSRLRIADFLAVAEWIWPREQVNKKSFILPKLEDALNNL